MNSTYEVNISKNTNRCLRGLKTRHHEKYREWEAQEVYIEGLTFCNLDEMETHGRKLKKKTSLMFDFYPTCLEKTKHVGIFTPGCYFPHMFGF